MSGVFISYRRKGARKTAYRLKDRLKDAFGADKVFVDVEDIDPGLPFDEVISKRISNCSIVLVVIGRDWLVMQDDEGRHRLSDPDDWVRRELEVAMASEARVIPLVVDGADDPDPSQLPDSLREFARLQTRHLSDDEAYWNYDVDRLIAKLQEIDPMLRGSEPGPAPRPEPESVSFSGRVIAGLILAAIAIVGLEATEILDTDTVLGALVLGVAGLAFSIWGYLDIQAGRTRGRGWAIGGIVLGVLATLAAVGSFQDAAPTSPAATASLSTGLPVIAPVPSPSPDMPTVAGLAGNWLSDDGYMIRIVQQGGQLQFASFDAAGNPYAVGSGVLTDKVLEVQFVTTTGASGTGRFVLSGDAKTLKGNSVYSTGEKETLTLYRQ